MMNIIMAASVLGGLSLFFGVMLVVAHKFFTVPVDPKFEKIRSALPGVNCAACGYIGCDALAEAILKEEAPYHGCPVGGAKLAEKITQYMAEV